jgi:hypothetical protein
LGGEAGGAEGGDVEVAVEMGGAGCWVGGEVGLGCARVSLGVGWKKGVDLGGGVVLYRE